MLPTYLYSIMLCLAWRVDVYLAKLNFRVLRNPVVHYRLRKSPSRDNIVSQLEANLRPNKILA